MIKNNWKGAVLDEPSFSRQVMRERCLPHCVGPLVAQLVQWALCAGLLAGCSGAGGGFFGGTPAPDPIRALVTPTGPKSLSGTIDLNSDPPGAQAATSLGGPGCQTPCSMEVTAEGPFTVTFTRQDYAPSTVSVQIKPGEMGVSDPKFLPNPVIAQLAPAAPPQKPKRAAPAKPTAKP
jgi:hypothetical protein